MIKPIRFGAGFAVFVLFFGISVLEALQTRNWVRAGFWLAIGVAFLVAENLRVIINSVKKVK